MRERDRLLLGLAAGAGICLVGKEMLARRREVSLGGRVVLITGGSRGLGLLLAKKFAGEGAKVAITARDESELAKAKAALSDYAGNVLAIPGDVTDRIQAGRIVEETVRRFGRVDILVNNAGIIQVGPAQDMTHQDFQDAMDVNFYGVLNMILAVAPQMRARKNGRIVNITSIGGRVAVPHLLPYSCSKFAATALSEGLRAELARDGITVTTILPGTMRTGSHVQAKFKGNQKAEYRNFSLSATLPLISISAEYAADQILTATKRGEAERVVGLPAQALATLHGLSPGMMGDLFGLFNQYLLPGPDGEESVLEKGLSIQKRMRSPFWNALLTLGRAAAKQYNELPGIAAPLSGNGRSEPDDIPAPTPS